MRIWKLLLFVTLPLIAACDGHSKARHDSTMHTGGLSQTGQGAYAALIELVEKLNGDKNTDWSAVNIDLLRQHLVDMNVLMLNAEVATARSGNDVVFEISGPERAMAAANRMVPAHSAVIEKIEPWKTAVTAGNPVVLTVSAANSTQADRIKALGFFGFMATGNHHQAHHLAMATGSSPHKH